MWGATLVYGFDPNWSSSVTIRLEKTRDIRSSLKTVEDIFRKYNLLILSTMILQMWNSGKVQA